MGTSSHYTQAAYHTRGRGGTLKIECCILIEKMKYLKISWFSSIVAYSLIILKGEMIGLPFLIWLPCTVFDFGNLNQLFGLLGVSGLILIFKNLNRNRTQKILITDFLCFILLAIPIIGRLIAVPLAMFNYNAFIIPTSIFVLCYLVSLAFSCKEYLALRGNSSARSSVHA